MKILIVEDAPDILNLLEKGLRYEDHQVETATNGAEAWEKFYNNYQEFDLIITDVNMPVMNGLEFMQRIREHDIDIPIVIITGQGDLEVSIAALKLGAFDYLLKPFRIQELLTTITKINMVQISSDQMRDVFQMVNGSMQFSIPSNVKLIGSVVYYLNKYFRDQCQLKKIDSTKVNLCIQEALANAVIHGNLQVDSHLKETSWDQFEELVQLRQKTEPYSQRQVVLNYEFDPQQLFFEISDEGKGFNHARLPDMNDPNSLLSSGRGLMLIRSYMDEVYWNETGNRITMVKYLNSDNIADESTVD